MKKRIFIIVLTLLLIAVQAAEAGRLWGFAWSENIGWIKFDEDAGAHWAMVDDPIGSPDDYESYIWNDSDSWQTDYYELDDPVPGSIGNVSGIKVVIKHAGRASVGIRVGGSDNDFNAQGHCDDSGGFPLFETSEQDVSDNFIRSLTENDIKNMQLKLRIRNLGSCPGQVTQVYVEVFHDAGPSVKLKPNGEGFATGIANPVPTGGVSYGVRVNDSNGYLSGYAWAGGGISSNDEDSDGNFDELPTIGWISFNPESVANCPVVNPRGSCQAYINQETGSPNQGKFYGWARACSVFKTGCSGELKPDLILGNWEGWIRLSSQGANPNYSIETDFSANPWELEDWAWGDEYVIGWTSFNRTNCDANGNGRSDGKKGCPPKGTLVGDYKVFADFNMRPNAKIASQCTNCPENGNNVIDPCMVYQGDFLCLINQSTDMNDSPGSSDIVLSEWFVTGPGMPPGSPPFRMWDLKVPTSTLKPSNKTWYNAKLRVTDSGGLTDETSEDFYIIRDIAVSFECSLDGSNYEDDCSLLKPVEGDIIYLRDTTVASEFARPPGNPTINRSWTVRIGPGSENDFGSGQKIEQIEAEFPSMVFKLTATDSIPRSGSATQTILGVMPLPRWQEIPPF